MKRAFTKTYFGRISRPRHRWPLLVAHPCWPSRFLFHRGRSDNPVKENGGRFQVIWERKISFTVSRNSSQSSLFSWEVFGQISRPIKKYIWEWKCMPLNCCGVSFSTHRNVHFQFIHIRFGFFKAGVVGYICKINHEYRNNILCGLIWRLSDRDCVGFRVCFYFRRAHSPCKVRMERYRFLKRSDTSVIFTNPGHFFDMISL